MRPAPPAVLSGLVLVVVADFLVSREHAEHPWERCRLVGSLRLRLLRAADLRFKFLGHQGGLMRREDYYD